MSKSKVFMIIGKSFSGKDTLLNNILNDEEFCKRTNLNRLVRYTNRKIRPGEVDGRDYNFVSDEYCALTKDLENVVYSSFESEFGLLYYMTDFTALDPNKNYIVVGDPENIEPYKKVLGDRLCLIYLAPPDWVLFQRFSKRDDNADYDDLKYKEIHRRYIDDLKKFNQRSNTFIAGCNCIIVLGKDYLLEDVKECISYFNILDQSNTCVVTQSDSNIIFSTDYNPAFNSSIKTALDGEIVLCNNSIVIDTENEKCIVKYIKMQYIKEPKITINNNLDNILYT